MRGQCRGVIAKVPIQSEAPSPNENNPGSASSREAPAQILGINNPPRLLSQRFQSPAMKLQSALQSKSVHIPRPSDLCSLLKGLL